MKNKVLGESGEKSLKKFWLVRKMCLPLQPHLEKCTFGQANVGCRKPCNAPKG